MLDRLLAEQVASRGRGGDSTLVHMAPEEINGLQALAEANGTSLTINPYTGYPEAGKLKKVFKNIGNAVGKVLQPIAKVLQPIAPILPFIPIPGMFGMSALLTKSLLAGTMGGYGGKDGKFDLKRALGSGAMAYGIGSLAQGLGSANAAANPTPNVSDFASQQAIDSAIAVNPGSIGDIASQQAADAAMNINPGSANIGNMAAQQAADSAMNITSSPIVDPVSPVGGFQQSLPAGSSPMDYLKQTGSNIMEAGKGVGSFFTDPGTAFEGMKAGMPINPFTKAPIDILTAGTAAVGGAMAVKTIDQLNAMKDQAQQLLDDPTKAKREEDIEWAKGVLRDYPIMYRNLTEEDVRKMDLGGGRSSRRTFAGGGIASLRNAVSDIRQEYGFAGGGQARFLSGGGDGMSDSIPATIANRQPARLADGEFVIPADVVSHVGNGSSKAGAKKLYAMMDRVRKARTGKKRQAPAVRAERYMPA
jgi:hypothetical protein